MVKAVMTTLPASLPATLRGRLLVGAIVGAVVVGALVARAVTAPQQAQYRTQPVTRANVQQTGTLVGSIGSAAGGHLTFRPRGTLAEVLVKVGQRVSAGQALARLDTSDLDVAPPQGPAGREGGGGGKGGAR